MPTTPFWFEVFWGDDIILKAVVLNVTVYRISMVAWSEDRPSNSST